MKIILIFLTNKQRKYYLIKINLSKHFFLKTLDYKYSDYLKIPNLLILVFKFLIGNL